MTKKIIKNHKMLTNLRKILFKSEHHFFSLKNWVLFLKNTKVINIRILRRPSKKNFKKRTIQYTIKNYTTPQDPAQFGVVKGVHLTLYLIKNANFLSDLWQYLP